MGGFRPFFEKVSSPGSLEFWQVKMLYLHAGCGLRLLVKRGDR